MMPLDDASFSPTSLQLSFKSVLCQPIELEQLFVCPHNTNQDERILTVRTRRDVRNTHIRFCIVKMSKWLIDNYLHRVTWWKMKVKSFSHVQLFVTPWTVAYQVPPSMEFFQARILECLAISFSRRSSRPRDWSRVSHIVLFSSVAQSCLTLCDPMNHSMPGLPVHHQLPESIQTSKPMSIESVIPSTQADALPSEPPGKSHMVNSNPISWLLAELPQHSIIFRKFPKTLKFGFFSHILLTRRQSYVSEVLH